MEKEKLYSEFLEISKKIGVPVKKVLDLFFALRSGEPIDNNQLLQTVGISRNAANQIKKALSSFLQPVSKNTQLTNQGTENIKGFYPVGYLPEESLWSILKNDTFQLAIQLLTSCQEKRPLPKRSYDQFTATLETTVRRMALLDFFGDVEQKRILFLGDDDFTSLAVATLGKAANITVLDIDPRILGAIKEVSNEKGFDVKTKKYDARKPLSKELVDKFDVVFTDPPYTQEGIGLFVSRGIEALDPDNQVSRIYCCYGNSDRAKERFLPIHQTFIDAGLMVRWVLDNFNRYSGAESIGSNSSLYICEATPRIRSLVKGECEQPIYTHD